MSNLISSQVSVTTGDIAKAAFGAAKQQLAAKIETLNKEYKEQQGLFEQLFVDFLASKLDNLETNPIVLDLQMCASLLNRHSTEYTYSTVVQCPLYQSDAIDFSTDKTLRSLFIKWFHYYTDTGYADKHKAIRKSTPENQNLEFVAMLLGLNKVEDVTYDTLSVSCLTVNLSSFLEENKNLLSTIISIYNRNIELGHKISGRPDPLTKLTLEEEITNTITMQAVSTLPDIAAVFNTSALAGTVIGGYLE